MTVNELIALLKELPGDEPVFHHGYEGGYGDIGSAEAVEVKLNHNEGIWYYGPHERRGNCGVPKEGKFVRGWVLS